MVCASRFTAEVVQRSQWQDRRILHQWRIDTPHSAGADQAFQCNRKTGVDRRRRVDLDAGHVGQIDVGWASPPFGLDMLEEGRIRLIARGSDAPSTRDQTVRVHIVNADALAKRRETMDRFVAAYRETYEWLYGDPEGVKIYADYGKVSVRLAMRIRDEFLPKAALFPDTISGIDALTRDAIDFKFMQAPLSAEQWAHFIQIPPRQ